MVEIIIICINPIPYIFVFHEVKNGGKKSKGSIKAVFENVNIYTLNIVKYAFFMLRLDIFD